MNKKSIAALAVAAVMTLGVAASSYAWFTSQATSTANTVTTGTLQLGTVGSITSGMVTPDNIYPGWIGSKTVRISNTGSLDLRYKMNITPLNNILYNGSTPLQVNINNQGFKNINSLGEVYLGEISKWDTETFDIALQMPTTAGNAYSGLTANFDFNFTAAQLNDTSFKVNNKNLVIVNNVSELKAAINNATVGETLQLAPVTFNITETINVNKAITIKGAAGFATMITTAGGNKVFNLSAGASLDGIFITKTDKVNQELIHIIGNDVTIKDSKFIGQYTQGDNEVTRAIVPNSGITGYIIIRNHFENLRQPAYLEGSGTVTNNFVKNTRGWVVCVNHVVTFTGNTFDGNAVDIAIIANNQTVSTNYTDIEAISAANNGAFVENQLSGQSVNAR